MPHATRTWALFPLLAGPLGAQNWRQVNLDGFGSAGSAAIAMGVPHLGDLYAGTYDAAGAEVWRYDGCSWIEDTPAWNVANEGAFPGAEYASGLFVGASNPAGAEVWWRNNAIWSEVSPPWDAANVEVTGMGTFSVTSLLYVATANGQTGCEVWSYDNMNMNWSQTNVDGFGSSANVEANNLVEFNGYLYTGATNDVTGCQVWRYDGGSWSPVAGALDGFGDGGNQEDARSMTTCNGLLYVGTENDTGGEVWSYDGVGTWTQVNVDGFGSANNEEIKSLACHNGVVYAGVETADGTGADVWQYAGGTSWLPEGLSWDSGNFIVVTLTAYRGGLLASTLNPTTGGEVWAKGAGQASAYCNADGGSSNNAASISITACGLSPGTAIELGGGPPGQFCYLLIGDGTGTVSQPPGSKGDLCLVGGSCLGRYAKDIGSIDGAGKFSTDISNSVSGGQGFGIPTCGGSIQVGQTWNFQFWHRQPMGQPSTFSAALSVTFL